MSNHYAVIVIGGGQSGLSISYFLKQRGISHLVLERNRAAYSWREERWDTFCLVTPNWQCKLPGFEYRGTDPLGFMKRDEIVRYIEEFVASFDPPIREGVTVTKVKQAGANGVFELHTTDGIFTADQVVVAAGAYHVPTVPRMAERMSPSVTHISCAKYKNPESLPEGDVLVVGSGQSGCQIAEDLHIAGRRVHLCVGGAPRTARRYRGKDVVEWLDLMGYYDLPVHKHPLKEQVRARANHYVTGRDGGRDIDLRKLASEGMKLYGRLVDVEGSNLHLADDLKQNLDKADEVAESIKNTIDKYIEKHRVDAPTEKRYSPVWEPRRQVNTVDFWQAGIRSVIWAIGYKTDFRWIEVPVFDGKGYPGHRRGVTSVPGMYFLGLPWLYTWGSGRFSGIARDAEHVADVIQSRHKSVGQEEGYVLDEMALGS